MGAVDLPPLLTRGEAGRGGTSPWESTPEVRASPKLLRAATASDDRSNLELAARMIVPLQDLPDSAED